MNRVMSWCAAVGVALAGCSAGSDPDAKARALCGQPAPDFTLTSLSGETVSLAAQRGKVVMLAYWAVG